MKQIKNLFIIQPIVFWHDKAKIANIDEMIPRAKLVIFTLSSAISLSIILKKKFFCIQSKLLGDYYTKLSNKYIDALNLKKINIDDEFLLKKKIQKLIVNH